MIFTGYEYRKSHTIYASRKNRRIPRFEKPRVLPVFKIRINGLTPAIKKNRPKPRFFRIFFPWTVSQIPSVKSNRFPLKLKTKFVEVPISNLQRLTKPIPIKNLSDTSKENKTHY
jgi:hypothetical protein